MTVVRDEKASWEGKDWDLKSSSPGLSSHGCISGDPAGRPLSGVGSPSVSFPF